MSNYKSLKIMKIVKSFNIEHQGCFSGFSFLYRERLCGSRGRRDVYEFEWKHARHQQQPQSVCMFI